MKFTEDFNRGGEYRHLTELTELNKGEDPMSKMDIVKRVAEQVKKADAAKAAKAANAKKITPGPGVGVSRVRTGLVPSLGPSILADIEAKKAKSAATAKRMSIEAAMKLRDKAEEPPALPAAVKSTKSDLENTPIMGTKMLPKAVKSSYSSTNSKTISVKPTKKVNPGAPGTIEHARKVIKDSEEKQKKKSEPGSSTRAAKVQEWKAKIARVVEGKHEIKREHVIVSALAFIPREKKITRMRTIMKMLEVDAKTAKAIFEEAKVHDRIPYITHPEMNSEEKDKIAFLTKQAEKFKNNRKELLDEVGNLDYDLLEARENCIGVANETLKVLKFIQDQFVTIFADEHDAEESAFTFMRRVLAGEIETFTELHRKAEWEVTPAAANAANKNAN